MERRRSISSLMRADSERSSSVSISPFSAAAITSARRSSSASESKERYCSLVIWVKAMLFLLVDCEGRADALPLVLFFALRRLPAFGLNHSVEVGARVYFRPRVCGD